MFRKVCLLTIHSPTPKPRALNPISYRPSSSQIDLPLIPLPPQPAIKYLRDYTEANTALIHLLTYLKNNQSLPQFVIGTDCEWVHMPYRKKVSIVTLAFDARPEITDQILVFHVNYFFPSMLKRILEHPKVLHVGRSIRSADLRLLRKDWGVKVDILKNSCPLESYCKPVVGSGNLSLDKLTRIILGKRLDKTVRGEADWSFKNSLTEEEIVYCARDSFASLKIYQRLKMLEDENLKMLEEEHLKSKVEEDALVVQ